jgi:hypothetical protein
MPAEYVDLPIYHEELAAALGFTTSDLEADRTGHLSAAQSASLYRRLIFRMGGGAAICVAAAAGSVVWALAIGIGHRPSELVLALAAVLLFAAGVIAVNGFKLWRDVAARIVSSVEGFVKPTEKETDIRTGFGMSTPVWTYYWIVGDQKFGVTGKAYGALTPARHRLYYLPVTRRVVAAEPISEANQPVTKEM